MIKKCKIEYLKGNFHRATEKLMIYIPTLSGYIRYDVHYSVVKEINCDCWRIEDIYHCDEDLTEIKCLSAKGEWECAVRLEGRPDFSGGTAHGDEVFQNVKFIIDGKKTLPQDIESVMEFEKMIIVENSLLYDPNDSKTVIAKHGKEYTFTSEGFDLRQSVIWQIDDELSSCYLAMFPVSKRVTDHVYFETDHTFLEIPKAEDCCRDNCKRATIYSDENNFYAEFYVSEYPDGYEKSGECLISDNGGGPYNKMYYRAASGGRVTVGTTWKSATHYRIAVGK